jgi:hypothetical protein
VTVRSGEGKERGKEAPGVVRKILHLLCKENELLDEYRALCGHSVLSTVLLRATLPERSEKRVSPRDASRYAQAVLPCRRLVFAFGNYGQLFEQPYLMSFRSY